MTHGVVTAVTAVTCIITRSTGPIPLIVSLEQHAPPAVATAMNLVAAQMFIGLPFPVLLLPCSAPAPVMAALYFTVA